MNIHDSYASRFYDLLAASMSYLLPSLTPPDRRTTLPCMTGDTSDFCAGVAVAAPPPIGPWKAPLGDRPLELLAGETDRQSREPIGETPDG